ncbi:MAG: phytanoyl-CoA dioxygenase family protein [Chloroflexi bacterium]|nr:phytanoyl-CoA dioxygenase family protein [Chloroflexota bacterium]
MGGSLSPEQVEQFDEQGYLLVKDVLDPETDLDPIIAEYDGVLDALADELFEAGEIESKYEDLPFGKRLSQIYVDSGKVHSQYFDFSLPQKGVQHATAFWTSPLLDAVESLKPLLDAVESLLGEEITCNPIQHLRAKPPDAYEEHTGPSFHNAPWHQDAAVMMAEAEASEIITCWLPLGEATAEMGCMEVLPGVVERGYLAHKSEGGTTIVPELMPQSEPVIMDCRQGDVVFMSRFTPHRSRPNTSNRCRWSLDLRYQPTGQHTGRTGHPDFVVRSASSPDSVLTDHDEWCRRWVDAFDMGPS